MGHGFGVMGQAHTTYYRNPQPVPHALTKEHSLNQATGCALDNRINPLPITHDLERKISEFLQSIGRFLIRE